MIYFCETQTLTLFQLNKANKTSHLKYCVPWHTGILFGETSTHPPLPPLASPSDPYIGQMKDQINI